jgi:hypothetical protein
VSHPAAVDHLRGATAAVFTAALAVAAHGVADGMAPAGGTVALLTVLSAALGAGVAKCASTSHTRVLVSVLATGQLAAHLALSTSGHGRGGWSWPTPSALMLAAHLVAVLTGAMLVSACERLYTALSSVARRYPRATAGASPRSAPTVAVRSDPPRQRALLIAASISHRGPPAGALR